MRDQATPVTAEQLGDDYYQDPLGHYARMRGAAPVVPAILPDGQRVWMITRYEDVRAALTDPRLVKDLRKLAGPDWTPDPVAGFLYSHLLKSDPPAHTRLRRLVQKAFTAGRVAALRPRIEEIADSLLDAMSARVAVGEPELDLIEQFAFPFPMTVMCELLGRPNQDRDQFKAWSQTLMSPLVTPAEFRSVGVAMGLYFTRLIAAKRQQPSGDLLSALIGARDDDQPDRERYSGAATAPVRAGTTACLPQPIAAGHRGTAAVHEPDQPHHRPVYAQPGRDCRSHHPGRRGRAVRDIVGESRPQPFRRR